MLISFDGSALREFDACRLKIQSLYVGSAAGRYEDRICWKCFCAIRGFQRKRSTCAIWIVFDFLSFGVAENSDAAALKAFKNCPGDFLVLAGMNASLS